MGATRVDTRGVAAGSSFAAEAGLEVWICPFPIEPTNDERLRQDGAEVVLVTGSELSLCNVGFVPGENFLERARTLQQGGR